MLVRERNKFIDRQEGAIGEENTETAKKSRHWEEPSARRERKDRVPGPGREQSLRCEERGEGVRLLLDPGFDLKVVVKVEVGFKSGLPAMSRAGGTQRKGSNQGAIWTSVGPGYSGAGLGFAWPALMLCILGAGWRKQAMMRPDYKCQQSRGQDTMRAVRNLTGGKEGQLPECGFDGIV